jgi:hypothetical protein
MEKSETGGSDPCHPVAKHLAAEVCTGTLAPFLRALGLSSLDQIDCVEGLRNVVLDVERAGEGTR